MGLTTNFKEYVLLIGLSGDDMLGEYRIFARNDFSEEPIPWTITATVNGVVEWVEEGVLAYMSSSGSSSATAADDEEDVSRRKLFTSRTDDDRTYFLHVLL